MEEHGESLVLFAKQPNSQVVECLKNTFSTPTFVRTGRRHKLLGLLVHLGAVSTSIPTLRARTVGC